MPGCDVSPHILYALRHLRDFDDDADGIPFETSYVFHCSSLGYYLIMLFGMLGWLFFMQFMCFLFWNGGLSLYWSLGQVFPAICFAYFMVACFEAFGSRVRRIMREVKADHIALYSLFHVRPEETYSPKDSINNIIRYTSIEDELFALLLFPIMYFLLGVLYPVVSVQFMIGMLFPLLCNVVLVDAIQEEFCRHVLRISGADALVDEVHKMSLAAAYRQGRDL